MHRLQKCVLYRVSQVRVSSRNPLGTMDCKQQNLKFPILEVDFGAEHFRARTSQFEDGRRRTVSLEGSKEDLVRFRVTTRGLHSSPEWGN